MTVPSAATIDRFDAARDFDQVAALWREIFAYDSPHNAPELVIEKKLEQRDGLFFVARLGQSVVGTVMAGYDGHRGWIYSLAVLPDYRGIGIGSRLLRHAEARLAGLGCIKVNLQIVECNEAAVGFYERLGYDIEPRISMGKHLRSG
ncbi:MAG: GNAT family acetyltransferase [Chloroflexi bacterium]|nr:GNAT family acetyltransferase [Chloroflexota bacterium]